EFARLATGEPEAILRFAREYGLLGYADRRGVGGFESAAIALGRRNLEVVRAQNPDLWGDPVPWIVAHARGVRLVGDLAAALDDQVKLAAHLARLTVRTADGSTQIVSFPCPRLDWEAPAQESLRLSETPRQTAQAVMATILDANLGGIDRHMVP